MSKKVQGTATQKPAWRLSLGVLLLAVGALAVFSGVSGLLDNRQQLIAPGGIINVEVADTAESRQQGLSNRQSLDRNSGMLFVFDETLDTNCFWMKDTLISLDMIWLNEDKQVITLTQNVTPDTFPESFCPDEPAKYGLEINAGRAEELRIEQGTELRF